MTRRYEVTAAWWLPCFTAVFDFFRFGNALSTTSTPARLPFCIAERNLLIIRNNIKQPILFLSAQQDQTRLLHAFISGSRHVKE